MKILVFTDGTVLVFLSGANLSREETVQLSQKAVTEANASSSEVPKGSVYDFASYVPIGHAVDKLAGWKKQGAVIYYLTSRRTKEEVDAISRVLQTYDFPDSLNLLYRKQGEEYKDVAEKLMPDILIEDDCESIGGEKEMTYTHLSDDTKVKVHSVTVKEFSGIDYLPHNVNQLKTYMMV